MKYNFDEHIERKGTQCSKWDNVGARTGNADALPVWVADTDFSCPRPILDAVRKRAEHPIFGYPIVTQDFRDATIHWVEKRHGWKLESDWIVYASGIVPVLNTLVQQYTEPGDEVIIQRPVYHPFGYAVDDNNRVISDNRLLYRDGRYTIDFDDLERRASSPRAGIMLFCSPHNPGGRVWTEEELRKVAEICLRNNVVLVSDEIHSDLVLFGHRHIPAASLDERYAMNTVTCFAPSKTFNIAGLRASGIVVPNPEIRAALELQFKRNRTVAQNSFSIPAYVAAYEECEDYLTQLLPYLEGNMRFLDEFLKANMPKIKLVPPESTFLAWLDCRETGLTGESLNDFFIHECKVGVSRGNSFGSAGSDFARVNVGCPRATLEKAMNMILEQYRKRGM